MQAEEFKIFLKKLKQKYKIFQIDFAKWCGYSEASIINYASNKQPVPRTLEIIVGDLQFKEQIGIDLKNIVK